MGSRERLRQQRETESTDLQFSICRTRMLIMTLWAPNHVVIRVIMGRMSEALNDSENVSNPCLKVGSRKSQKARAGGSRGYHVKYVDSGNKKIQLFELM